MTTIYGIRNCDTMKRAFTWLDNHHVEYDFHDYKKNGIDSDHLERWSKQAGWQTLLNTRGTTWRKLTDAQRANMNETKARKLMQQQPSLIKRPVLTHGKNILVGFDEHAYATLFGDQT